jgi:hypothetical protein
MNRKVPVLFVTAVVLLLASMQARALDLRGTLWEPVAGRHGLDAPLLYAIAVQESGRPNGRGAVIPWPWTLRANGEQQIYSSAKDAGTALREVLRKKRDVRIGLFQVRLKDHSDRFGDPATLLDARSTSASPPESWLMLFTRRGTTWPWSSAATATPATTGQRGSMVGESWPKFNTPDYFSLNIMCLQRKISLSGTTFVKFCETGRFRPAFSVSLPGWDRCPAPG